MPKNTYKKRADGRYCATVTINDGFKKKRKFIYADSPQELDVKITEIKSLNYKGFTLNSNNMTVSVWADSWFKAYKTSKEKATQKMYKDAINLYIKPSIGEIKLKNLKEMHITSMLNKLNSIPRTQQIVLLTIRQIIDKAIDNDYIYKNVAKNIKLTPYKPKEKKSLSTEELILVEKVAKKNPNGLLILTLIYTGMRREEIVPLLYKDIDIKNRIISINKAVHFEHNQVSEIKTTKNKRNRTVPILDIIYADLIKLKKIHKENDLVFGRTTTKMHSEATLNNILSSFFRQVTIEYEKQEKQKNKDFILTEENKKRFTLHQLRHSYATILYRAGIGVKDAQELMGHQEASLVMDIYTHLDNEDKEKSANKLNEYVSKICN